MNAAVSFSLADRGADLRNIPLNRIRMAPPPGAATVDDIIVDGEGVLDGKKVLPGWTVDLKELFARLDQGPPKP